jgi:hypothetical protein
VPDTDSPTSTSSELIDTDPPTEEPGNESTDPPTDAPGPTEELDSPSPTASKTTPAPVADPTPRPTKRPKIPEPTPSSTEKLDQCSQLVRNSCPCPAKLNDIGRCHKDVANNQCRFGSYTKNKFIKALESRLVEFCGENKEDIILVFGLKVVPKKRKKKKRNSG